MPDDFVLFLALILSVEERNTTATQQGLRLVALKLEQTEAIQFTQRLVSTLGPGERFWLRNLLGHRPEPGAIEAA